MNNRLIIAMVILVMGCNNNYSATISNDCNITIKTVDTKNKDFRVQSIEWWYYERPDKKFQLHCETGLCSRWVIEKKAVGSIVVHATGEKRQIVDKECWDLYEGQKVVSEGQCHTDLTLLFRISACK